MARGWAFRAVLSMVTMVGVVSGCTSSPPSDAPRPPSSTSPNVAGTNGPTLSDRSLALTNAVKPSHGIKMIPLGVGPMEGVPVISWADVSWTGETLAAGQRAVQRVLICLDQSHN